MKECKPDTFRWEDPVWKYNEAKLEGKAQIVYLPYMHEISTSQIRGGL